MRLVSKLFKFNIFLFGDVVCVKMLFKFDSADRTQGSSSDFNLTLKNGVTELEGDYRVEIVSIPVSWYNVTTYNNAISLFINGAVANATLAAGQYNVTELCAGLKSCLDAVSAGAVFTVSIEGATKKLNISCDRAFELRFRDVINNAASLLGFSANDYLSSVVGSGNVIIAEGILNLNPIDALAIKFNGLGDGVKMSNAQSCSIMAPIASPFGTLATYQFEHPPVLTFTNKTRSFDVRITDARTSKPVDLNGVNWYILLRKA